MNKKIVFQVKVDYVYEQEYPYCQPGYIHISEKEETSDFFDSYEKAEKFILEFQNTVKGRKDIKFSINKYWVQDE